MAGPNNKRKTRVQYVAYRLRVLRELGIAPPSPEKMELMKDEAKCSDARVDAIFLDCILKSE